MTEDYRVSPTRISKFAACKRRWWFEEIIGLRDIDPDSKPYLAFGTEAHDVAEEILEGREPVFGGWSWAYEVGRAFADLTLDACDRLGGTEQDIEVDGASLGMPGGGYKGRLDAWGWRDGLPILIDHKTSGNPKRACADGPNIWQLHLYGFALMQELKAESFYAQWHWLPSKRRTDPLDGVQIWRDHITLEDTLPTVKEAVRISIEMAELVDAGQAPSAYFRETPDILEARCYGLESGYYPCDFAGECESEEMIKMGSLLKKLATKQPTETASAPKPKPTPNPGVEDKPVEVGKRPVIVSMTDAQLERLIASVVKAVRDDEKTS